MVICLIVYLIMRIDMIYLPRNQCIVNKTLNYRLFMQKKLGEGYRSNE